MEEEWIHNSQTSTTSASSFTHTHHPTTPIHVTPPLQIPSQSTPLVPLIAESAVQCPYTYAGSHIIHQHQGLLDVVNAPALLSISVTSTLLTLALSHQTLALTSDALLVAGRYPTRHSTVLLPASAVLRTRI